jgi:hypothetical protein
MKKESRLLLIESPTVFQKTLACTIGLNAAIFLQQLNFWLTIAKQEKDVDKFFEGRWWVRNTYCEWEEKNFPFWSIGTIKRIIAYLENDLHVVLSRPDSAQNTNGKWYTIDFEALDGLDVLPANIGQLIARAGGPDAKDFDQVAPAVEPVPAAVAEPQPMIANSQPATVHVRAHSQYRGIACGSAGCQPIPECAGGSTQNESGGLPRMSRPPESECAGGSTQNESTSRLRLKELKNKSTFQKKNQRAGTPALEAGRAAPPLIPPTAPVVRTGAVVLQLSPEGAVRPIGHNQWAEPGWRDRVSTGRTEYRRRLAERKDP